MDDILEEAVIEPAPEAKREIIIPYAPRSAFLAFHETKKRWAIIVAHRRAGKTVAAVNKLVREAIALTLPNGRYGLVAPFRSQAKEIAWKYLQEYASAILAGPPNESELRVDLLNGSSIRLYGADNPDALRGAYFDGVILDEFGMMREGVWSEIIRPMLADRKGWAVFIGTPKGANAFRKLWRDTADHDDWYRAMIRADSSNILDPEELEDMQEDMSPEEFDQEMLCSFEAAVRGAYYAEQLRRMDAEGRITHIDIDRAVRVHTAWDLGRRDYMAIWFIQCVGRERRLIDYYENNFQDLSHYAEVIHDKRHARSWIYGQHYFPHDIAVHMLDTKLSRLETLRTLGIEAVYPLQAHAVMDGINATRRMLDRTWIDPAYCEKAIEHLRNYRADWDEGMRVFKTMPRHDEHSHCADALRCFATQYDDPKSVADDGRWRRRFQSGPKPSAWSA